LSAPDITRLTSLDAASGQPSDLVLASERLFRGVAAGSSVALARHLARLHDQLASVRATEHRVLDDLDAELETLAAAIAEDQGGAVLEALARFFARRIRAAPELARLQDGATNIESI
jgi:hypothetical protein